MKAIVKALNKNYLVEFKNDADFLGFVTNFNDKIEDVEVITEDKLPELEKPVQVAKPTLSNGWDTLNKSAFVDKEKGVEKKGMTLGGKYAEFKYEPDKNLENATDDKVSEPKIDSPALKGDEPKVSDVEATAKENEVKGAESKSAPVESEPKAEESPKADAPKAEESPKADAPKAEEPKAEEPKAEEEKKEEPAEEPKKEESEDKEEKKEVEESYEAELNEVMEAAGVESEEEPVEEAVQVGKYKYQTVSDLMNELQKYDPDAVVIVSEKWGRGAAQFHIKSGYTDAKFLEYIGSEEQTEEFPTKAIEISAAL